MFNPTKLLIEAFIPELKAAYDSAYSNLKPEYASIIA
jgi:hypothetical protein